VVMAVAQAQAQSGFQLDWSRNRLTILSPRLPGGRVEVWHLEAYCRRGSTRRRWEETVVPHRTERLNGTGPAPRIRLRDTIEGGAVAEHDIRAVSDGIRFTLTIRNASAQPLDIEWGQPCIQVAGFTGRTQETYLPRCFLFVEGRTGPELRLLSDLPRAEEAVYRGGQVYVPAGISRGDVNPRPLSSVTPVLPLIGCFSGDGSQILATAWQPAQELFQGVITCIHADFRVGGLKPGETKRLQGRIYLIENDPALLLRLYRRDFGGAGTAPVFPDAG